MKYILNVTEYTGSGNRIPHAPRYFSSMKFAKDEADYLVKASRNVTVFDISENEKMNLSAITKKINQFAKDRDWEQFHSPKNLSMALSVEASELVEIFQWMTEADSHSLPDSKRQAAADEIADIQVYLLRISSVLGIDIESAVESKLQRNAEKYPADLVRGSSKKYTEYGNG